MEILVAKAKRIKIGDPQNLETEMGPLATKRQLVHVQDVVDRSVAAGRETANRWQSSCWI
jgi:(Z)-2-((N-methylformamido)methylene)-5-hydroxybutyrolactone dehydrogenase